MTTAIPMDILAEARTPSLILPYSPAPRFCPTKEDVAYPKETAASSRSPYSLLVAVKPATYKRPKPLITY